MLTPPRYRVKGEACRIPPGDREREQRQQMAGSELERVGVVLVNTGTPASPAVGDVRRYLAQFLNDPRVIDMPAWQRWLLLHLVILRFRPAKSAAAYAKIWTPEGSPLRVHGLGLAAGVQALLGDQAVVRLGFQFGEPSIPQAFKDFADAGLRRVCVVPLFPQYAAASTGSAVEAAIGAAAARWVIPALHVVPAFWSEPEFLAAMASAMAAARAKSQPDHVQPDHTQPDHILFSFHGVPEHHCTRTDETGKHCLRAATCCDAITAVNASCYRAQCFATARALCARLGLAPGDVTVAFQSRLGRIPWIQPHTDTVLTELAKAGKHHVMVVEPSFVADCLETLEEIGMRGREDFQAAGGDELTLVPSLNATAGWVAGLTAIIRRSCSWLS